MTDEEIGIVPASNGQYLPWDGVRGPVYKQVGGKTMVKMDELKALLTELGFENVTSYINSGNIGFGSGPEAFANLTVEVRNKQRSNRGGDGIVPPARGLGEDQYARLRLVRRAQ